MTSQDLNHWATVFPSPSQSIKTCLVSGICSSCFPSELQSEWTSCLPKISAVNRIQVLTSRCLTDVTLDMDTDKTAPCHQPTTSLSLITGQIKGEDEHVLPLRCVNTVMVSPNWCSFYITWQHHKHTRRKVLSDAHDCDWQETNSLLPPRKYGWFVLSWLLDVDQFQAKVPSEDTGDWDYVFNDVIFGHMRDFWWHGPLFLVSKISLIDKTIEAKFRHLQSVQPMIFHQNPTTSNHLCPPIEPTFYL